MTGSLLERAQRLRAQAAKARTLALCLTTPNNIRNLLSYADEQEAKAQGLERQAAEPMASALPPEPSSEDGPPVHYAAAFGYAFGLGTLQSELKS